MIVAGALVGAGLAACSADDVGSAADARAEAYDYPVVDLADDPAANIERLQVPDDVLDELSSEALVWSVLDFPYVGNAFAADQLHGEVAFLAGQCNALDTLLGRDDAAAAVDAVRTAIVDGDAESEQLGEMELRLLDLIADEVAPA